MKRLLTIFFIIKNDIILLYKTLTDPNTAKKVKIAIIGMIVYVLSPIDIVSDIIPVFGQLDDIAVVMFITNRVKSQINTPKHNGKRVVREITNIK